MASSSRTGFVSCCSHREQMMCHITNCEQPSKTERISCRGPRKQSGTYALQHMNARHLLAKNRSEHKQLSVQPVLLNRGSSNSPDERTTFSRTFPSLCLTIHILLVSLPCTDSQSDQVCRIRVGFVAAEARKTVACTSLCGNWVSLVQTRCAQGFWWGPDAAGGDNLVIAARFATPNLFCRSA